MKSIIAAFRQRRLEIDFIEMLLVQNRSGNGAVSYSGKGFIRQTDKDSLIFKIYVDKAHNTDFVIDFNSIIKLKSGEIYDEESFYTLTGVASDGSKWCAERILPNCTWLAEYQNPVVHGDLHSCMCGDWSTDQKVLVLHFFDEVDLLGLTDDVRFIADCREFHIHKDEGGFFICVKSDTSLPAHFEVRIEEALRFLLARSVAPRVFVQGDRLKLMAAASRSRRTALEPPIARNSHVVISQSWDLFRQYLSYVINETKSQYWNPVTGHIHNAIEASANSLDAWAIGIGVAVEGLAMMLSMERDEQENENIKTLQRFIIDQVNGHEEHRVFAARIRGLIGSLTSIRAIDRMNKLAEKGGADRVHVAAWKKLRNRGVHPTAESQEVGSLDYQRFIDDLHRLNVLLYHIVFHIIGYRGPYTDYGTRNFPIKDYPLMGVSNSVKSEQP
ncbi:MAG: hypothetical protein HXX10_23925 [Rhodoplanes sp.]|uniref:hypothetical protein n=1 Tax=Rhodoplanes sp. TaxID=1968906 RepID=UPI0017954407|nr:hypothetical protein [Rhodoplanes sp.]NVO17085.1 hypothetical protein [Rhodoplanes sp.]